MRPVFRSNLFALIVILVQIFATLFLGGYLLDYFGTEKALILTQLLFLILPEIIYLLITRQSIKKTLRLNRISFTSIVLIIAIALLSQPIAAFLSALTGVFFENPVGEVLSSMNKIPLLVQIGTMALTPAICEESVVRGVVLSGYDNVVTWKAALATGLIFGLLHLNPQQLLYAFALGILFVYLVRITNSIFASMICHFTFNGFQVTMSYLLNKFYPEEMKNSSNYAKLALGDKLLSIVPYFFAALIFGAVVYLLVKALAKHNGGGRVTAGNAEYAAPVTESEGYFLRGEGHGIVINEERVFDVPYALFVVVSIIFMVIVELYAR